MRAPIVLAVLLLVVACKSQPPPPHAFDALIGQSGVLTLVTLHPDEPRSRLFSVNYQQAGLIPVCTPVTLLERNPKRLLFRNDSTGKTYEYVHHEIIGESLPDHLTRVFGSPCPRKEIDALPKLDRQGILEGRALVGMTRRGVVLAMGYPPPHATPSLESTRWIYWTNRMNKLAVMFDEKGRVSAVQN
jgi:hypothetical protein